MSLRRLIGRIGARLSAYARSTDEETTMSMSQEKTPSPAPRRRRLGACSVRGPVRKDNQDRVHASVIASVQTMVLADGMGGLPHGGEAADLALQHAVGRLRKELAASLLADAEGVRTLLLTLLWSTANRLARAATLGGWTGEGGGFRTTLVVVVALPDCYVCAWIGDGGIFVQRATGDLLALVEPHKQPETPNILDASLGPVSLGRPSWALAPRLPGDLLFAATDGIADLVDDALAVRIRAKVEATGGDARRAARQFVRELAEEEDVLGNAVFTDNLTIALLAPEEGHDD